MGAQRHFHGEASTHIIAEDLNDMANRFAAARRALLNRAALRACGYTKETPDPPGGQIVRDSLGNPTAAKMMWSRRNLDSLH